jgi:hypothetical protein
MTRPTPPTRRRATHASTASEAQRSSSGRSTPTAMPSGTCPRSSASLGNVRRFRHRARARRQPLWPSTTPSLSLTPRNGAARAPAPASSRLYMRRPDSSCHASPTRRTTLAHRCRPAHCRPAHCSNPRPRLLRVRTVRRYPRRDPDRPFRRDDRCLYAGAAVHIESFPTSIRSWWGQTSTAARPNRFWPDESAAVPTRSLTNAHKTLEEIRFSRVRVVVRAQPLLTGDRSAG